MTAPAPLPFDVVSPVELPERDERRRWLVEGLWPSAAVGIIGGQPKCGKTWMALDLAVSVASGTPCLGTFSIVSKGAVLIYAAEDSLADLRSRLTGIAGARGLDVRSLDIGVIVTDTMRLDSEGDRNRLRATLESFAPVLLVLDPFVRLHGAIDENSSAAVSTILGELRALQRHFETGIALVHHARKNSSGCRPGQALRGSSDFHAWGDVMLYLGKQDQETFRLVVEHRTAASPGAFELKLDAAASAGPCLRITGTAEMQAPSFSHEPGTNGLDQKIIDLLSVQDSPISQKRIRTLVRARNKTVGETLKNLEGKGLVERLPDGWIISQEQLKLDFAAN